MTHAHPGPDEDRLRSEAQEQIAALRGGSTTLREMGRLIERLAASTASVLVTGETGTGKEVVARVLHARSTRRGGPFVALNCSAVPEPLLESELFGHVRGAFTDACAARTGLLVQANGGTLLLDEVGDMPLALQPKFLRVLQERVVRPVGGDREIPFDARIVATTHRDLEAAVAAGTFREDLWFRLNVVSIEVPPLRARGRDVLLLAEHFVAHFAGRAGKRVVGLDEAAAERLLAHAWPGNVRELRNCIERAVALTGAERIGVEDLPARLRGATPGPAPLPRPVDPPAPAEIVTLDELERRHVRHVLAAVGGSKTLAARKLGITRRTLYRKLERLGDASARAKV